VTAFLVFWISAALLAYTYGGYHLLLRAAACCMPGRRSARDGTQRVDARDAPTVAVIVAVYNEERVIARRLENLLALDYPRDRLQIVVASDGSTDRTVEIARRYASSGVAALALPRRGKALAQNDAVAGAHVDIIVFTDADSEFDRRFLRAVVARFREDDRVGCVVGNLAWRGNETATGALRTWYWGLETDLRRVESQLGILAGSTGAGMAVRREVWRPMGGPLDDSDSLTPLDVILQGGRVVFADDAIVHDVPFSSARSEFRAKVRGVSKSVTMILRRWGARESLRHPVITWRLVSHHFLRWLGPFVAVAFVISTVVLAPRGGIYLAAAWLEALVLGLGLLGYLGERSGRRVPVASVVYNFLAINAGMAIGFLAALFRAAKGPWETE